MAVSETALKHYKHVFPWTDKSPLESYLTEKNKELQGQLRMWKGSTQRQGNMSLRPESDVPGRDSGGQGMQIPDYEIPMDQIEQITKESDVLGSVLQTLRSGIFKEGLTVKDEFDKWCPEGHEVGGDHQVCPEHGIALREPDPVEEEDARQLIKNVNDNNQDLVDVLKQFEDDVNTFDIGYIVTLYDYVFHPAKPEVLKQDVDEILRGDPKNMRIIANSVGRPARNDEGERLLFCPRHRSRLVTEVHSEDLEGCPIRDCDRPLWEAYFASSDQEQIGSFNYSSAPTSAEGVKYYAEWEVISDSKYEPSLTYGFPQPIKVFNKTLTLLREDEYLRQYFSEETPSKKFMILKSNKSRDAWNKAWKYLKAKAEQNKFVPAPFITPQKDDEVEIQDLVGSLDELKFMEHRKEFRNVISTTFGVMPMFSGDSNTAAFTNQAEVENVITEKAIRDATRLYNDKVLYELSKKVFDLEDHLIQLQQPDFTGEMDEVKVKQEKARHARLMAQLGFDLDYDGEDFQFNVPEEGLNPEGVLDEQDEEELKPEGQPQGDNVGQMNKEELLRHLKKKQ